jgi:superfamily I DNA and RNA helicase
MKTAHHLSSSSHTIAIVKISSRFSFELKNPFTLLRKMFAHSSSVDEKSRAQPRGQKSNTSSHLPNIPLASSSHGIQRRALCDISNRKVQQDDPKAVDRRTNATQTPFPNQKGLQETLTNEAMQEKTVNFTDLTIVMFIKSSNVDKFEAATSAQTFDDVDDDDEIERPAVKTL